MYKIKIGIIADTHLSKHLYKIQDLIKHHLKNVDMVIHAGDYKNPKVIDIIESQKKFAGVWGNNDGDTVKGKVREKEIISIEGHKIGIYHGHGTNKNTTERAYEVFKEDNVNIIIFGHSHQPIIKTINKTLMLNPGSPTSKRKERWYSYIILDVERSSISAQLNFFEKLD